MDGGERRGAARSSTGRVGGTQGSRAARRTVTAARTHTPAAATPTRPRTRRLAALIPIKIYVCYDSYIYITLRTFLPQAILSYKER